MATSGSTNFELDVADYIEEAFERCGLEARTGYDLKTARRSLNLVFADWANRGLNRWTIRTTSIPLAQGHEMDPTADTRGISTKVGIDATYKRERREYGSRVSYPTINLNDYLN